MRATTGLVPAPYPIYMSVDRSSSTLEVSPERDGETDSWSQERTQESLGPKLLA